MIETPFNYTGSKFKLLEQLLPEFDYTKPYFVDLFCGGGSVYTNVVDKYEKLITRIHTKSIIFSKLGHIQIYSYKNKLDWIQAKKIPYFM